jgi:hypothetical protein
LQAQDKKAMEINHADVAELVGAGDLKSLPAGTNPPLPRSQATTHFSKLTWKLNPTLSN